MITINKQPFGNEEFHNGEVIYKGVELDNKVNSIEMKFEDNRDIATLIFAVQYIREKTPKDAELYLKMLYIPYSRMDREIESSNQLFSLRYFSNILKRLEFDKIYVLDPHSDASGKLIDCIRKNLNDKVNKVLEQFKADYLFYPDKGAYHKYPKILNEVNLPYFYGDKTRDFVNKGRISSYALCEDHPDLQGKKVLIIDDICCLGGTAYMAAKLLKEAGASEIAFYISHCENGIFVGHVLKPEVDGKYLIDKVFTAGTMPLKNEHENLIII